MGRPKAEPSGMCGKHKLLNELSNGLHADPAACQVCRCAVCAGGLGMRDCAMSEALGVGMLSVAGVLLGRTHWSSEHRCRGSC